MQNSHDFSATPSCIALPDKELYSLCKQYGGNARKWTRKFAFLLPEVLQRSLHRKYGYQGINEFAAKLCGMSAEVVTRVLWLHRKLVDKPLIWEKFEVYGWTKLRTIANVVEVESQQFWLDKLGRLTHSGLVEYVQTWKRDNGDVAAVLQKTEATFVHKINDESEVFLLDMPENGGALEFMNENPDGNYAENPVDTFDEKTALSGKAYKKFKFNLDAETEFRLKKVKQQLEKERGAVTFGETLKYILEKLEAVESLETLKSSSTSAHNPQHVEVAISNSPTTKTQARCTFSGCNEPYDEEHHPYRSSLSKNNKNLTPLCSKHHHLAHSGLIQNEKQPTANWKLQTQELPGQLQHYLNQTFTARTDSTVRRYLIDS